MNPFLLSGYKGPEYFCDREEETENLILNIINGSNTAFFAPRRIGKTSLIQHVFHKLKSEKKYACVYIDIYATQNLKDFINMIATGIYNAIPKKSRIGLEIWDKLKRFRPIISLDEMSGNPQLILDINQKNQIEQTLSQLFNLIDAQKLQVAIAIDEFQQILNYPEKNVEALLRSAIQQLKNTQFIFFGSNQKMIHEIFNNNKRPFYASTKNINLKKIDANKYSDFIKKQFKKKSIKIDSGLELILSITDNHTYYTQRLCHEIVQINENPVTTFTVTRAIQKILHDNESTYFQYRKLLTATQWYLLKAIALEEKVEQPYNKNFLQKYQIGTPSSVKRTLESLLEKEMVYHESNVETPYYEVYDKFLMRWFQRK